MADQVPQPAPACGLRTVHRRADAGRAEPEQRLARVAVVARYEGDGRDSGKLAYEPGHRRELVAAAGVDREDERVHPLPPGRPQRVPERAGVDGRKTAVARRIEARSEEHTSELQSRLHLVCRLLLEKKKKKQN